MVLANWTGKAQRVTITDPRLGNTVTIHTVGQKVHRPRTVTIQTGETFTVTLPVYGFALAASLAR